MMSTLGTGRTAQIILEDGSLSDTIDLDRGRAQGDSPSPRQYNIGEQILLLKLELDPGIVKLNNITPEPRPLARHFTTFRTGEEVLSGQHGVEGFADDTNVVCKMEIDSLHRLVHILETFGALSGLKCNLEKTCLMYIGPANRLAQEQIAGLGFQIVDNIKVLGYTITAEGLDLENIYTTINRKVIANISTWSKFNLSLPGRIRIAKTFLCLQVSYH